MTTSQTSTDNAGESGAASQSASGPQDGSASDGGGATDTAMVPESCGNGVLDPTEVCDDADLGELTCKSLGYVDGMLQCEFDACSAFDTTECIRCGAVVPPPATCVGLLCDADSDCQPKKAEACCDDPACAGACAIPCSAPQDCPEQTECAHGHCLRLCNDDSDCALWFGFTCQHDSSYCENGRPH